MDEKPTDAMTTQATLGYGVLSTLMGRVPAAASRVRAEHDGSSLTISVVGADGRERPAPAKTAVTMYFEEPVSTLGGGPAVKIVTGQVDGQGKIRLSADKDKVIASLIVQLATGNVTVGRVPPPERSTRSSEPSEEYEGRTTRRSSPKSKTKAPAKRSPSKRSTSQQSAATAPNQQVGQQADPTSPQPGG